MGREYLKSIHGICSIISIIFGFLGLIASTCFSTNADFYILLVWSGKFWPSLVILLLFFDFIYNLYCTITQIQDIESVLSESKLKVRLIKFILFILIVAVVESRYVDLYAKDPIFGIRYVFIMICAWIMFLVHVIQGLFIIFKG
uniref:DUF5079 family protein n=1 Tax=Rhabditophanes sp. KR3021 TaxID=114890 RepID=A0AC35TMZ3_9BILA